MLVAAVLGELTVRFLALLFTGWAAYHIGISYIATLTDAGRAYLTIIDLLHRQDRPPPRV